MMHLAIGSEEKEERLCLVSLRVPALIPLKLQGRRQFAISLQKGRGVRDSCHLSSVSTSPLFPPVLTMGTTCSLYSCCLFFPF